MLKYIYTKLKIDNYQLRRWRIKDKTKTNIKIDNYQLGRWRIEDKTKTNIKIDLANEDHCGTCLIKKSTK
jgi:hypothetical protein